MKNEVVELLKDLPYASWNSAYAGEPKIEKFALGLSHQVFKVSFKGQKSDSSEQWQPRLVAKYVANRKTRLAELQGVTLAHERGAGVPLIYQDEQWLITEYFEGQPLSLCDISERQKLDIALGLLACFHHEVSVDNKSINLKHIINDLLEVCTLTTSQEELVIRIVDDALDAIEKDEPNDLLKSLFIHGDVNYSNILYNPTTTLAKLIDFEAASFAPVEYELGMMMAVNNIAPSAFFLAFDSSHQSYNIKREKVTCYCVMSCLINWLWYVGQEDVATGKSYGILAKAQLEFLEIMTDGKYSVIEQMR